MSKKQFIGDKIKENNSKVTNIDVQKIIWAHKSESKYLVYGQTTDDCDSGVVLANSIPSEGLCKKIVRTLSYVFKCPYEYEQ